MWLGLAAGFWSAPFGYTYGMPSQEGIGPGMGMLRIETCQQCSSENA